MNVPQSLMQCKTFKEYDPDFTLDHVIYLIEQAEGLQPSTVSVYHLRDAADILDAMADGGSIE